MRFSVLGPFEIRGGDVQRKLGHGRARCLLALLVLHRSEVVSADRVIGALWAENPPAAAQTIPITGVPQSLAFGLGRLWVALD